MDLERCANGQNFSSGTVKFSCALRAEGMQYIPDLPHRSHSNQLSKTSVFQAQGHASRHIIHVTAACKSVGRSIDQCRTAAFARPGSAYCPHFRIDLSRNKHTIRGGPQRSDSNRHFKTDWLATAGKTSEHVFLM